MQKIAPKKVTPISYETWISHIKLKLRPTAKQSKNAAHRIYSDDIAIAVTTLVFLYWAALSLALYSLFGLKVQWLALITILPIIVLGGAVGYITKDLSKVKVVSCWKRIKPVETEGDEKKPEAPTRGTPTRWWHVLILAILVILFFSMSVWNLGDSYIPTSNFTPQQNPENVFLDLGKITHVDTAYLLVQDHSNVDVNIYWGSPESWNLSGDIATSGIAWHQWDSVTVGQDTRYIRLEFIGGSGQFGEVALFSGNHKLIISNISTDGNITAAKALIDEQSLVDSPITSKSGTYFDEVYYVWTAEQYLNLHNVTDWESQTNWDHPLLGKLIITASIVIFGHDPFGWRIAGVIFAALSILLVFLLARRMFRSPRAGLIAAFLLTFDFMHFAQARVATPDTCLFFFFIGMVYFFYCYWQDPSHNGKNLFWSLVFFGLGFSTKWFVLYGFAGLMLLLIIQKMRERKIRKSEVYWFIAGTATAVAIYMLCYLPYFLAPLQHGGLSNWWKLQLDMYRFQANLRTSYPGASPWYTWPLMLNPIWFYLGSSPTTSAYIASFGNPALWWASIPIMIATLAIVIAWIATSLKNKVANFIARVLQPLWHEMGDRRKTALFIIIPFLTQWLLFIPIHRVVMIYSFYPSLLFVILATALWCEWLWTKFKWGKWAVGGYLALNVACFILFFPAISGLPMSNGYWGSPLIKQIVHWISY